MSRQFRTILSAVDFDNNSFEALATAANLARCMNATLFVLHILKPSRPPVTQADVDACVAEERSARDRLSAACHEVLDGLSHEFLTRTGDPAITIIRAEEELKADLVVLATHVGRDRPKSFPGSVAERVVRESICPVVTVRPSAYGDPDAVGTHMTAAPLTTSPEATVLHVRQMMIKHRVRSLPVLENAKVVGIVTERDLASGDMPDSTTIGLMMTRDVISISPRASLQEAGRLLFECEVNALPVVDEERLVGVITRSDVLKAFAHIEA
jgi:CBS domain-containing protein